MALLNSKYTQVWTLILYGNKNARQGQLNDAG